MFLADNINAAWSVFKEIFTSILDCVAPIKEIRIKQGTEPWMTTEILSLIQSRDFYFDKFKKSNNSDDYKNFCKIRNQVQRYVNLQNLSIFSVR